MHPIHSLVLNGGRPPAVRQDDLVGGNEIEADAADGEGGEQDMWACGGGGGEGGHGGVAGGGAHGAVDAGEGEEARG